MCLYAQLQKTLKWKDQRYGYGYTHRYNDTYGQDSIITYGYNYPHTYSQGVTYCFMYSYGNC